VKTLLLAVALTLVPLSAQGEELDVSLVRLLVDAYYAAHGLEADEERIDRGVEVCMRFANTAGYSYADLQASVAYLIREVPESRSQPLEVLLPLYIRRAESAPPPPLPEPEAEGAEGGGAETAVPPGDAAPQPTEEERWAAEQKRLEDERRRAEEARLAQEKAERQRRLLEQSAAEDRARLAVVANKRKMARFQRKMYVAGLVTFAVNRGITLWVTAIIASQRGEPGLIAFGFLPVVGAILGDALYVRGGENLASVVAGVLSGLLDITGLVLMGVGLDRRSGKRPWKAVRSPTLRAQVTAGPGGLGMRLNF
jgi:hypothetical protein